MKLRRRNKAVRRMDIVICNVLDDPKVEYSCPSCGYRQVQEWKGRGEYACSSCSFVVGLKPAGGGNRNGEV